MQANRDKLIVKKNGSKKIISGGVALESSYVVAEVISAPENSKYRAGDTVMFRDWYGEESPAGFIIDDYDVIAYDKG